MDKKLIDKLNKRKDEGTLRSLSVFDGNIDFHSNDYLSLARVQLSHKAWSYGSTGSRLISGNSNVAENCEDLLAEFFKCESALIFNSGYDANLGLFSSVPQKGDTVIYDEDIHASVRDGIRLSFANSMSFRHNDVSDLEKKLSLATGHIYIAVESLYSMNGDLSPLKEILEIAEKFDADVVVDEAHSAGVYGASGRGYVEELGLTDRIFARLVTFGKAFGSHGAAVIGSYKLKQFLINFARSFIYTTALPTDAFVRIQEIINKADLDQRRSELSSNISIFRTRFSETNLVSHHLSPIQIVRVNDRNRLKSISEECIKEGLNVKAIFSPTVRQENECLRISIHAHNKPEEITRLANLVLPFLKT